MWYCSEPISLPPAKEPLGGTSRDQNLVPEVGKSHVSNQFHFCRVAEPEIRGENLADRNSELQVEPDTTKEDMAASKLQVEPENDPDEAEAVEEAPERSRIWKVSVGLKDIRYFVPINTGRSDRNERCQEEKSVSQQKEGRTESDLGDREDETEAEVRNNKEVRIEIGEEKSEQKKGSIEEEVPTPIRKRKRVGTYNQENQEKIKEFEKDEETKATEKKDKEEEATEVWKEFWRKNGGQQGRRNPLRPKAPPKQK